MISEAIQKVLDIAKENIVDINNTKFDKRDGKYIAPPVHQRGKQQFKNLDGFLDFCQWRVDQGEDVKTMYINAHSCRRVALMLYDDKFSSVMAEAEPIVPESGRLQQGMNQNDFIVALKVLFAPNDDLADLMQVVSSIDVTQGVKSDDDGISQRVVAKHGIVTAESAVVRPVWNLAMRRTFAEIEPPVESPFLLRIVQQGEKPAMLYLYDMQPQAAELKTCAAIKQFILERFEKTYIIVA